VNTCSLWVLSILLALVLHSGSRRRVLLVGAVFLLVTTALYGLYVVGAYSLLSYASYLSWIQRAVAAVVGAFAIVNMRDYMAVFLIDELVLFGAIVVTMRAARLQEHHGRMLRLVTGSIMLTLAVAMLWDPNLLGELDGVIAVLVATVALAVALAAIGRRIGVRSAA